MLLKSYGIDETELLSEFNDSEDPRILLVGMAVLNAWKMNKKGSLAVNNNILGNRLYAQSAGEQIKDCFLEATGITAGIGAINSLLGKGVSRAVMKRAVLKLIKIVGKRAVGWFGVAVMVSEFTWCMSR